jgi:hypothetical protein
MRIFEVRGDQTTVPFLSCSIPHLKSINLTVSAEISNIEIDTDGRLNSICGTL